MLFNLNRKYKEVAGSFLSLFGSGFPSPGAVFCGLLTNLTTFLFDPLNYSVSINVSKQTTIT